MKKTKPTNYLFVALLIPFLIALVGSGVFSGCNESKANVAHVCSDKTHLECDGGCECEVMKTDYQINLHNDTVWIYDGNRFVGKYTSNWNNQMDTILLTDNQ